MTQNENELIELIRGSENSERALMAAAVIILGFLKQLESSEAPAVVCQQALY